MDYRQALTHNQQKVVQHREGPALVIAGPGSGKTHAITYRVAYMIEHGIAPWNILLLTFTKKAAKEMLNRVKNLVGDDAQKVYGGTFHSVAARALFKHSEQLGYAGQISILDQGDAIELVGSLRKQFNTTVPLPSSRKIQSVFSRSVNTQTNLCHLIAQSPDFNDCQSAVVALMQQYRLEKQRMNLVDFDDLLVEFRRLLQEYANLRTVYSNRHKYIIIDEYQDTNRIQADIALALASQHQNLLVVGDDCQSIYGFRGADIRNILTFTEMFPDAAVYQLTENFRSHPPIVSVANALIAKAEEKLEKTLTSVSTDMSIRPEVVPCSSQMGQAEYVAQQIKKYHEKGIPYDEIAVLYRNGYHANLLDMFLTTRRIPYIKVGGVKLTESVHIKDILSFLRVRANPRDKISWQRVLRMCPGVGEKTAEKTLKVIEQTEDVVSALAILDGKQKYKVSLRELGKFLHTLDITISAKDLLTLTWEYYEPIFEEKFESSTFEYRRFGIEHLLAFAETEEYTTLTGFLAEFVLSAEQTKQKQEYSVTLTTIHSAKGLEFSVVFIIECIEGALPSYRAENIEEELRLLYVAVTRAKHHLIVTYPETIMRNGKSEDAEASRFLAGLPYVGVG